MPRNFIPWDLLKVIIGNSATIIYLLLTEPFTYTTVFFLFPELLNDLGYLEGYFYMQALLWKNICFTNRYQAAHWLSASMHFFTWPWTLYNYISYDKIYNLDFLADKRNFE